MLRNLANRIFGDAMLIFNREEEHARNRLYILGFSISANVIAILYGGYFFTGLLLKLGADDAYMGLVTAATYACGIAAVFSPLILQRFAKRKTLLILSRGLYYLLLLGFITAMPTIGAAGAANLSWILAFVVLANILSSLTASGLSAWHLQSLPEAVRSSFYANLNMIAGILNMILLNLSGLCADYFKARGQELLGIELLRGMAFLVACLEIWNLSRIREYPYAKTERMTRLKDVFTGPQKDRRYRAVMAAVALWTFSSTIPGPFFQVYLLKDLNIGYSFLSVVNLLNIPVLLIAMPIWGRAVARYGDVKLFPWLVGLVSLHFLSLAFVTKSNCQWLYPISIFYYFVIAAGIAQAASLMPFRYIPEENRGHFISFYAAVNTLAALLGTLAGLAFVMATENAGFTLRGLRMGNKQLLMALAGAAVLLGAVAVAFIHRWLARNSDKTENEQTAPNQAA